MSFYLSNSDNTIQTKSVSVNIMCIRTASEAVKLKSIGQRAFSGCGRLCGTLELPPGVTAIEYGAFMGCDNLRYVLATGDKITTLGDNLFGNGKDKLTYKKK